MPPRSSCGPANWSLIPVIQSYPDAVEIEIRAGFCDPDPELLPEAGRRLFEARGPLLAIGAASLSV